MEATITIAGERHSIGRLTLGDMRLLATHFGVTDMTTLAEQRGNPHVVAGFAYLALKRTHPDWEHARLMNTVDDIALDDIDDDDEPVSEDPNDAATGGE